MANNTEVKKIINVDAKSVKELKKNIQELRDTIVGMYNDGSKGSEEYEEAVKALQGEQRKLNDVMALTKKEATALPGSYDALVKKMKELKAEWRATNDEARRNQLGEEINDINNQLKELDATTGNFQRNVGNYNAALEGTEKTLKELKEEIKQYRSELLTLAEGTEEYNKTMQKLADAQFQLRDMNEQSKYATADFGEQLSNVTGIASGLMSGFSAVQGAMALCGVETADFEKTMIQLQSAMAIVQGLQGLEGTIDRVKGLTTVIKTATKAIGKGGWIGIIIAAIAVVSALVGWLVKQNKAMKDGVTTTKEYNKAIIDLRKSEYESVAGDIAKIEALNKIVALEEISIGYGNVVTKNTTNRRKAAMLLLSAMKQEINEQNILNVLNGKYNGGLELIIGNTLTYSENIRGLIERLKSQAEAQAALNLITQKYNELFDAEFDADKNGKRSKREEKKIKNIEKELKGLINYITGNFWNSDAIVKMLFPDEVLNELAKQMERTINGINIKEGFKGIAIQMQDELDSINFNMSLSEEEKAKRSYNTTLKYLNKQKEAYVDYKNSLSREYFESDLEYAEFVEQIDAKIHDIETQLATATYNEKLRLRDKEKEYTERFFNQSLSLIENNYNRQLKVIEMSDKTEKEKAEESYNTEIKYQQQRLTVLRKYLDEALADKENNKDLIFSLEQQIADGLIALDEATYKERLRQQEEYFEKANRALEANSTGTDQGLRRNAITDYVDFDGVRNLKEYGELDEENMRQQQAKAYEIEQQGLAERVRLLMQFKEAAAAIKDEDRVLEYTQEIADLELEIEENKYAEMKRLREQNLQDEIESKQKILDVTSSSMDATASILNSIADMNEANGVTSKKEFEMNKRLRISSTIIDGLSAGIKAFATAPNYIIGGIQAAAIAASTAAAIAQIKNTKFEGSSFTPSASMYENSNQIFTTTRQLTGAKEYEELNKDTRVFILESDIQASNKKVQIRENETSF